MIEKVNPKHPDKVADRIAGAIVDLAYKEQDNPKIAVEVLIGHNECNIIIETDTKLNTQDINDAVYRISETKDEKLKINLNIAEQDKHLAKNQEEKIKCGDNGIFKGLPLRKEEKELSTIARYIFNKFKSDGKYILNSNKLIICQSKMEDDELNGDFDNFRDEIVINPLGEWEGGFNVDTGATNRKLGSDMAHAVTGGGLHGKDLSKADVSVNIYAFLKAQELNEKVELSCAIGDEYIDGKSYDEIVNIASGFINNIGGFEKFAEWGLY